MRDETSYRTCEFCLELNGDLLPEYYSLYGIPKTGRIIAEFGNYQLLSDLAPLVVGHSLLVPRSHDLSMSLSAKFHDGLTEAIKSASDFYAGVYGNIAIIEHGTGLEGSAAQGCVSHAHLHFIPCNPEALRQAFEADFFGAEIVSGSWENLHQVVGTGEYVLLGGASYFTAVIGRTPPTRQYARVMAGRSLGVPELDYWTDTCIRPERVNQGMNAWRGADVS